MVTIDNPFRFLVCKQVSTFLLNLVKMWLDHKSELICLGQLPTGVNIFFVLDCSQSPIFSWDRLDIPRVTVTAILIFKCTEGAAIGDYSSGGGGGGEKNRGTVIISLQLVFT